ncbi:MULTISPECIES: IclR family transcriptional regulator [Cupriavidus]|uniref:IclR family transcriptional regulator n=1 Tax=Cupriavidus TaxID=106589 RepID=UPI00157B47B8|nr:MULTISPECIES: IclR family transcriptional regulator [Cupriavidus]MBB1632500.1 hypothetical protein [Cupriavidus sp. UME77]NUA27042.1 IclR family transcriptional regulator [Cupriavidus basilensis]
MDIDPIFPQDDDKRGVLTGETALRLLSAFLDCEALPMLKTLALRADIHPSKAHRYLVSLCRQGYVEKDKASNRYRLGSTALRLGFAARAVMDAVFVARPLMPSICKDMGCTVALALWCEQGPTIALAESARGPFTFAVAEGTILSLVGSAIGETFAAWLPRAKVSATLETELAILSSSRIPGCPANLLEAEQIFAKIRERGLARSIGLREPDVHSLAAPVFAASGDLAAVLCAVGSSSGFDSSWSGPVARGVSASAAVISRKLGHI